MNGDIYFHSVRVQIYHRARMKSLILGKVQKVIMKLSQVRMQNLILSPSKA